MLCLNCGADLVTDAQFCHSCGTSLKPGPAESAPQKTASEALEKLDEDGLAHTIHVDALSENWRIYYWANIILNPLIVLLLLFPDLQTQVLCIGAIWTILSGLINPRVRGFMAGLVAGGVESFIATIASSCGVILFGSIGAIILLSIFIVFAAFAFGLLLFVALVFLWVDALRTINRHKDAHGEDDMVAP